MSVRYADGEATARNLDGDRYDERLQAVEVVEGKERVVRSFVTVEMCAKGKDRVDT